MLEAYGEAIRLRPDYAQAYYNRACGYSRQQKDIEACLADLEKASEFLALADTAYKEAMKLRPKEKYFRPAFDRIQAAEDVLEAWDEYRNGSQSASRR